MSNKKADEMAEIERLHRWIDGVGGNISFGDSVVKSVEESKDGDKLTIVLKKRKQKKKTEEAES